MSPSGFVSIIVLHHIIDFNILVFEIFSLWYRNIRAFDGSEMIASRMVSR